MIPSGVIISDSGTITVSANGKLFTFANDHINYKLVKEALKKNDLDAIPKLADIPKTVQEFTGENIMVQNGVVMYKGKPLNNNLTNRILTLMNEGFPFAPMLKFLENLMQNTSFHSIKELYNFLVHRNLPITEDGCFLAYKAVKLDFMDWHTGTVNNEIGVVIPRIERNEVDDNWRLDCGSGYHVGAMEYVDNFHRNEGHIMIVKVNPKDVVSVPEGECTKCRTTFYEVVGEMQEEELIRHVYATTSTSYQPSMPNSMASQQDEGWSDEDEEDDDGWDTEDDEEEDDEEEDGDDEYGSVEP